MTWHPDDAAVRLQDEFALHPTRLEPVIGGADRRAQVWRAEVVGRGPVAVKLSTDPGTAAHRVVDHLAGGHDRAALVGVPAPVTSRSGLPWSDRDGRRMAVTGWVEGRRGHELPRTAVPWTALGRLLRTVHDAAVPESLAEIVPTETRSVPALADTVRRLDRHTPEASDLVGAAAAAVWRRLAGPLRVAVAVAGEAPAVAARRPAGLAHTDPHLGNVVVDQDGQPWLLDWDDVALAPRERDLVFSRAGVPFFGPVCEQERAAFDLGYGPVEVDPGLVAAYAAVRALEDATDWAGQALDVRLGPAVRAEALTILRGLGAPDGLVTRAAAMAEREPPVSAGSAGG